MTWRRGLVMGGGGCGTLGQPYVLWDTRVWRADAMGHGLRAMPNLGIGGPQFDLDVYNVGTPGDLTTIASHNNDEWLGSPRIPWSAVGGLPCAGPFTVLMAWGEFPEDQTYAEGDMLFANGKYVQQFGLTQCLGFLHSLANDQADRSTFAAVFHGYGFGSYNQWNLPTDVETVPGSATQYLRNTLIAVTMDSVDLKCDRCYSNNTTGGNRQIPEQPDGPGQEEFFIGTSAGDCADHAGETYIGTHHFFYCGEHRSSPVTGASPGVPFDSMVGTALFRGVPSAGSMQYWYDYFYGPAPDPLPPYVSPFPYSGGFSKWTDGTYAYHEFGTNGAGGGSLVPVGGYTLPATIDFWLIGGGGGGAGYGSPVHGAGGGGGEVIEVLGIAAPVTSQTFVQGAGGASRTNGGSSTFMGYTARGGRGATSSTGGLNGNLVTAGGTGSATAGGGGGGAGGAGVNAVGTSAGKGGLGREIVTIGGSPIPWAAGGHAGGYSGTIITPQSQWVEPGGLAATSSPIQVALRGGGGGGRVSSSNTTLGRTGFPGAAGGLVVRYLLP